MQLFSNALKDVYSCKLIIREQNICEALPLLGPVDYVWVVYLTMISVSGLNVSWDVRMVSELRTGRYLGECGHGIIDVLSR
jgi:hypothetical protein